MPVVLEPDPEALDKLLDALPPGGHGVDTASSLRAWVGGRSDEYCVVLGSSVAADDAFALAEELRLSSPSTSIVLVREDVDTALLTRAMHAGVREVVPREDSAAVTAAVERAQQLWSALRGPAPGAPRLGTVVTVFSPKGGVGKTTMTVNLAVALSERGSRKVCIVDLDLAFGDVAITLQLFPSHSIEHAVGGEESMDFALVEPLLTRHEQAVQVLAAPSLPDTRERVTPRLVAQVINTLKEHFDYVVVDTAPAFDEQTLAALDETDECVVVATLDVPTLKNVKVALETMDMLHIAEDHRHLLLNRADDAVGIGPDKVEAILGMPVAAQVATSIDVAAATNAGSPIVVSSPDAPASVALKALAGRLRGDAPADDQPQGAEAKSDSTAERGKRFRLRR